ncbi:helix-turn-helix domain-containing protein [Bacillus pinisoli]|uniref:helix-turn-helix domain-containing protein n=1 Tax=Bacillus pinisoli TaxID=2901866 RepID=UPI001FF50438|nr:helix-turn-helix transcriptional regulator [Bacillus pinisoli]
MLDKEICNYLESLKLLKNPDKKMEGILEGCTRFFPFQRASIFTYSPLNYYGEGILQIEYGKFNPMCSIKEDVRTIPPLYFSITNKRPLTIKIDPTGKNFPLKYVKQFNLTSMLIIPVCFNHTVIGTVFLDHFKEIQTIENYDSISVYHYYKKAAEILTSAPHNNQVLSNREIEVLQRLSYGYSLKEMADDMNISEYTVRDYLTAVNRKLGTKHRAEAVGVALRTGIIS